MTREEAIKRLQEVKVWAKDDDLTVIDMAIEALSQPAPLYEFDIGTTIESAKNRYGEPKIDEELKAEVTKYFKGLASAGRIDYWAYMDLYNACMPILEECYDRMKVWAESEERK